MTPQHCCFVPPSVLEEIARRGDDAQRDAALGTALIATGSAVFGLGRRLPPPPEVHPTPTTEVVPDRPELARPE